MRFEQTPRRVCFARAATHHVCTLWAGHDGNHEAWNDVGELAHTWPPQSPAARGDPDETPIDWQETA